MRSLEAHLRQPGGHGHLPFHHGCPVCRAERLSGAPPPDELVSARTRAGLAAAILAASALPAVPAAASEPDTEQEGSADEREPGQAGDASPGFDEGTEDTDLPVDEGVDLPAPGDDGEVEQTPESEGQPQEDGPDGPTSVPEGTPLPAPGPLPPIPVEPKPPALEDLRGPAGTPPHRARRQAPPETNHPKKPEGSRPAPAGTAPVGGAPQPSTPAVAPGPEGAPPAAQDARPAPTGGLPATASRSAPRDGRTHIVRVGECLWSIAHDQIGGGATPAQVARLVNRLWNLNRERIGTGEPDLLMVGTELQLP